MHRFGGLCKNLQDGEDRVIDNTPEDLDEQYLKTLARALPSQSAHFLSIAAHHPKREACLHISFQKVHLQLPLHRACLQKKELTAWVVWVPPKRQEPLKWILLTTIAMVMPADAWEVVEWYGLR